VHFKEALLEGRSLFGDQRFEFLDQNLIRFRRRKNSNFGGDVRGTQRPIASISSSVAAMVVSVGWASAVKATFTTMDCPGDDKPFRNGRSLDAAMPVAGGRIILALRWTEARTISNQGFLGIRRPSPSIGDREFGKAGRKTNQSAETISSKDAHLTLGGSGMGKPLSTKQIGSNSR